MEEFIMMLSIAGALVVFIFYRWFDNDDWKTPLTYLVVYLAMWAFYAFVHWLGPFLNKL